MDKNKNNRNSTSSTEELEVEKKDVVVLSEVLHQEILDIIDGKDNVTQGYM